MVITNDDELAKAEAREQEIYENNKILECAEELEQIITAIMVYKNKNNSASPPESNQTKQ